LAHSIRIEVGSLLLDAELFDTTAARAIHGALPIESPFETWGDEFYFTVPVSLDLDHTATARLRVGDIGYWPPGRAIAIFFGRTPASSGEDPVAASDVNVVGRVTGDPRLLAGQAGEVMIRIDRA
jgi:hypothetical protein